MICLKILTTEYIELTELNSNGLKPFVVADDNNILCSLGFHSNIFNLNRIKFFNLLLIIY